MKVGALIAFFSLFPLAHFFVLSLHARAASRVTYTPFTLPRRAVFNVIRSFAVRKGPVRNKKRAQFFSYTDFNFGI